MVGPAGFEPATSALSERRSKPTELRTKIFIGGGGRIRTHETLSRLPDFKSGAFSQALPLHPL